MKLHEYAEHEVTEQDMNCKVGDIVKVIADSEGESFWVIITEVMKTGGYKAKIDNKLLCDPDSVGKHILIYPSNIKEHYRE